MATKYCRKLTVDNWWFFCGAKLLDKRVNHLSCMGVDLEESIWRYPKPHVQQSLMNTLRKRTFIETWRVNVRFVLYLFSQYKFIGWLFRGSCSRKENATISETVYVNLQLHIITFSGSRVKWGNTVIPRLCWSSLLTFSSQLPLLPVKRTAALTTDRTWNVDNFWL